MKKAGLAMAAALFAAAAAAEAAQPALSVETLSPRLWRVREQGSAGSLMNRYGTVRDFPVLSSNLVADGAVSLAGAEITVAKDGEGFRIRFPLDPDERVYGLGDASRANLQRRPGRYEVYVRNISSYIPIPMAVTSKGRGFFLNTTWPNVVDVGETDKDAVVCTAKKGTVDFYVFTGRDFRELLEVYTSLTGRPALLPAFAFGFSFVCNQWINAFDLLQEAREFRDRELPCDVLGLKPGWMENFWPGLN